MMSSLICFILIVSVSCEMLVTKEYVEYLKKTVTWEVQEYENNIFRGWTIEDANVQFLMDMPEMLESIPPLNARKNLPSEMNWAGANCDHGVRDQGRCNAGWAMVTAGMLSDRCCIQEHDHGWLSPQVLLSCDKISYGCSGGWAAWALHYVMSVQGLPLETCFSYEGKELPCPTKCVDGSPFTRFCDCVGGFKSLPNVEAIKTALQSGPVALHMEVCRSFFSYRSGIYKCDCGTNYAGFYSVLGMGYSDLPDPHFHARNSWGTQWGIEGYFDIDTTTCGIAGKYSLGTLVCENVGP
jgi:C1A family cysteine protease